jgi:hypothetical protein
MVNLVLIMRAIKHILFFAFLFCIGNVNAQFYNGSQMEFGKNRIQYSGYLWTHYNYDQYQVFFYEEGKNLADYIARSAHLQLGEFEKTFEHKLQTKIQFIVYNSQSQSKESNIGHYANETSNTGGFARTQGSKVFIYFNGSHKDLDKQIRSGVAKVLLEEVIYGDDYKEVLKNSALITLPNWYLDGLISYLSEKWSAETENVVKEYFKSEKFNNFSSLVGIEATYAGHSLWYYLADKYGENSIANILYMAKINRNIENGFLFVLGKGTKSVLTDWRLFYKSRIKNDNIGRLKPSGLELLSKYNKDRTYDRFIYNGKSTFSAYVTNELSQQKVWVHDVKSNEHKRIFKKGHKLDIEPDYSFPIITWHPSGEILSVFYEEKGELLWLNYNVVSGEKKIDKIVQLEKILEASYSQNGHKMVFSAVKNGKTDIYVYDIRARAHEQITDDYFDDRSPVFVNGSNGIVFSSNRTNDTMNIEGGENFVYQKNTDLFLYNYSFKKGYKFSNQVLRRVTNTPFDNEFQPYELKEGGILYLSDKGGIVNQWKATLDSAVSFVDTTIHYRYFSKTKALSNYNKSILWHSVNAQNNVGVIFKNKTRSQIKTVSYASLDSNDFFIPRTEFKKVAVIGGTIVQLVVPVVKTITIDSIRRKRKEDPDYIYTSYYLFSDDVDGDNDSVIEVIKPANTTAFIPLVVSGFPTSDSLAPKVKLRNYELLFRTQNVGVQLDNRFLNPQYQRYSGGINYPNPGMNGFMKYSVVDLMEDYYVVGGFRIGGFESNELFLSYIDRKKRLDKQYLFYRNTHLDLGLGDLNKNVTYEGIYRLHYPLTMVDRISTTMSLRYDQFLPLSANKDLLNTDASHEFWPNIRVDYTYDNTRNLGLNLYSGLRFKVFSEYYQQAPEWDKKMLVLGADFRNYTKIHRTLIWANRLAGGTSLGSQRLIFYMGGADSWMSPSFNDELAPGKLSNGNNYLFQTLATNLRGFDQNIRNGTSFLIFNSEIRWPIVKYFVHRPLTSSILNNFQIVFFGDVGTAWTGLSPFSEGNSLNEKDIVIGGVANTGTIHLETNKEPIVGGYGIGARTKIWGYFLRADWGWGVEDGVSRGKKFYLSLTTDF